MFLAIGSSFAQKGSWYIGTSGISLSGPNFTDGPLFNRFVTGFYSYKTEDSDRNSVYGIAPEVGYFLSDKMAVGLNIGYNYSRTKPENGDAFGTSFFGVNPYVRYYAFKMEKLSLYVQGGIFFATINPHDASSTNAYGIGIKPGIAYQLSNRFAINATFGNLGYANYDGDNEYGLTLNGNSLGFGLTYSF